MTSETKVQPVREIAQGSVVVSRGPFQNVWIKLKNTDVYDGRLTSTILIQAADVSDVIACLQAVERGKELSP